MMALIFGTMLLSMVLAWVGQGRLAVVAILCCLALSVGEFLWLIYSPNSGFRMPWIQVHFDGDPIGFGSLAQPASGA